MLNRFAWKINGARMKITISPIAKRHPAKMDIQIVAHALALDVCLVSNNTREFERVTGLKLENWAF